MSEEYKAYVGNISFQSDENSIKDFFSDCGEVTDVKIITDRETGRSRGFGFVSFDSDASLEAAIGKSGSNLDGRELKINKAEQKPKTKRF